MTSVQRFASKTDRHFLPGGIAMNTKRRVLSSLLCSLVLMLGAAPAWAVNPHSIWNAVRVNTAGSSFINMSPSGTTFCYLRSVGFENTDTDGELATCRVTRGAVVWTLEAVLNENNDADARCSAYCYTR
jgi:hypothetical protein